MKSITIEMEDGETQQINLDGAMTKEHFIQLTNAVWDAHELQKNQG